MNKDLQVIIKRILKDIKVELSDEFDKNFERQSFFGEGWQRRSSPTRPGGTILVDTGNLRKSIRSRTTENSIVFYTDLPYAAIHNNGGDIKVTKKMKRYFWYRYYSSVGAFGRKKNGDLRNDRRTRQLTTEAEFWKWMALKKEGTDIHIPRRQFLGKSPEVEQAVKQIVEENLADYFANDLKFEIK